MIVERCELFHIVMPKFSLVQFSSKFWELRVKLEVWSKGCSELWTGLLVQVQCCSNLNQTHKFENLSANTVSWPFPFHKELNSTSLLVLNISETNCVLLSLYLSPNMSILISTLEQLEGLEDFKFDIMAVTFGSSSGTSTWKGSLWRCCRALNGKITTGHARKSRVLEQVML